MPPPPGGLTSEPDSVEAQLEALHRFFLLRYREEVRRKYPFFRGIFPLDDSSRLDLVLLNGGGRVHFLYQRGDGTEHLVVFRELTLDGPGSGGTKEESLVRHAVSVAEPEAHFVLDPPYHERFDQIEEEALAAVTRHSRKRPPGAN